MYFKNAFNMPCTGRYIEVRYTLRVLTFQRTNTWNGNKYSVSRPLRIFISCFNMDKINLG